VATRLAMMGTGAGGAPPSPVVDAERLDALGGMAAGFAHHLNNILMVALGNIQLTLLQDGAEGPRAARLRTAEHAVQDAAEVVKSLMSFCRTEPIDELRLVDLNELVDEVVDLTSPRWREETVTRGVTVSLKVEHGAVALVMANAMGLRQVLINVVFNALEAMPDGGALTLRTWTDDAGVHCSVSDTGVGMPPELVRRAIEPFHTTKGPRTRGLGLPVAYGIVTRHGGRLSIDSVVGLGTAVRVTLPIAEDPLGRGLTPPGAAS